MRNPFWRLKALPWGSLFLAAALTIAIATVADIVLGFGFIWLVQNLGPQLMPFWQLLAVILPVVAGFGIGALALAVMEQVFRQVFLNTGVLWALVACLAVALFIKSWLPVPALFVTVGSSQVIGALLGIFMVGKRYWR